MYKAKSVDSNEFISHEEIMRTLAQAKSEAENPARCREILDKAAGFRGLTHQEAAALLEAASPEVLAGIFTLA